MVVHLLTLPSDFYAWTLAAPSHIGATAVLIGLVVYVVGMLLHVGGHYTASKWVCLFGVSALLVGIISLVICFIWEITGGIAL
jgi:D-alanyl-lipoteichoic acid acyltransferase DltB (MBOAT superfamily)